MYIPSGFHLWVWKLTFKIFYNEKKNISVQIKKKKNFADSSQILYIFSHIKRLFYIYTHTDVKTCKETAYFLLKKGHQRKKMTTNHCNHCFTFSIENTLLAFLKMSSTFQHFAEWRVQNKLNLHQVFQISPGTTIQTNVRNDSLHPIICMTSAVNLSYGHLPHSMPRFKRGCTMQIRQSPSCLQDRL